VVGVGHHLLGIVLALLTVLVLVGLDYVESGFKWLQKSVDETFIHRPKNTHKKDDTPDNEVKEED